ARSGSVRVGLKCERAFQPSQLGVPVVRSRVLGQRECFGDRLQVVFRPSELLVCLGEDFEKRRHAEARAMLPVRRQAGLHLGDAFLAPPPGFQPKLTHTLKQGRDRATQASDLCAANTKRAKARLKQVERAVIKYAPSLEQYGGAPKDRRR